MADLPVGYAAHLLKRVPHHDIRADAEDVVQDCALWLLERQHRGQMVAPREFVPYLVAVLRDYVRWFSGRPGSQNRRHYGWHMVMREGKFVAVPPQVHPDGHESPEFAWGTMVDPAEGEVDASLHLVAQALGCACKAWHGPEWVPWAWVFHAVADVTLEEIGRAVGLTPQRVGQWFTVGVTRGRVLSPVQSEVFGLLSARGQMTHNEITEALGRPNVRHALSGLRKAGHVVQNSVPRSREPVYAVVPGTQLPEQVYRPSFVEVLRKELGG